MPKIVHRRGTSGPNHPNGLGQGKGVTLKGKTAAKQQLVTRSQKVDANDAYRLAKGKK